MYMTQAPCAKKICQLREFPLSLGKGKEVPQTCGVPPFKASSTLRVQLSAVIQLRHSYFIRLLHLRIALEQTQDSANILGNLRIGTYM